jgi:DNA modification methylase/transcription elongation factor Elf1
MFQESFVQSGSSNSVLSMQALAELASQLVELRNIPGCPTGTDAAILLMSSPPGHTACPNPFITDWLSRIDDDARPDPGPFSADTTAGKTSIVYKAHSFPTKVPHEAIMRLILHYTRPGDVVLDGFCGTGMTGVAAQMCGAPSDELRGEIESEMGKVEWGTRRCILQDLLPSATFIAAGLNLPVNYSDFDRASAALLRRFDAEWRWMYETHVHQGSRTIAATIDYTVWSEIMTCPHCGDEVVFYDAAFDRESGRVAETFKCPTCGAQVSKTTLKKRLSKVRTMAGDVVDRTEFRPVAVHWRSGNATGVKAPDDEDFAILRRIAATPVPAFPTVGVPYMHMTHERSPTAKNGFARLDTFWSDRALASLAILWNWAAEEDNLDVRRALRFWIEQGFWGLSWMNRYRPDGYSQVSQYQSGVYYVPALVSECSVHYNLEGTSPARGKRANLVKLWKTVFGSADSVRISTASSTNLLIPDNAVDYIFVDPPFGENIYYSDLAFLVEGWHGVFAAPAEEAIIDKNRHRPKRLTEYANLIERCFTEFARVLKPGRWMTVEFSNSSNDVWLAIQHALASAGFVVADTRVFDKEQHSYRQVTATNAVKRDLIISAYKPAAAATQIVELAKGSEEGVRAFLAEHLSHLPVKDGRRGEARLIRERRADRLYDRAVAYHVARGIGVPMTTAQFFEALDHWFMLRNGMYFLPHQAEEWERFRVTFKELQETPLFITGEGSAVHWLRQFLKPKPRSFSEIQPAFFAETQKGTVGWDELPDLRGLLEQNFVQDAQGRWLLPDPKKADHLEQLRNRELLRVFEGYRAGIGPLERFRSEAVRAGFKQAWANRDYGSIVAVGRRLPPDAFVNDTALLHYFRNSERMG